MEIFYSVLLVFNTNVSMFLYSKQFVITPQSSSTKNGYIFNGMWKYLCNCIL